MAMVRLLGLGGVVIAVSGCQSWQVGDVESLPPTASLPDVSEMGKVELRYYDNIAGSNVENLLESPKYPDNPDEITELTSLDVTQNRADSYGSLVRGYITPKLEGEYIFYVSGDDGTQLWLSTDSTLDKASPIAAVPGWTNRQDYTRYSSQTSATHYLQAGKRYYFELRHKEGGGDDHFSVAWKGPDFDQQIIGSAYISSLGRQPFSSELTTTEAYSLGYRVGYLDGNETLAFNPEYPPMDNDQDGIYDNWEIVHRLDPTNPDDALSDPDGDLIVAADEFLIGTAENNADTDEDGIPDGVEYAADLDPLDPGDATEDLDGDGFSNVEEYLAGTNINNAEGIPKAEPIYSAGFVGQYFTGMSFDEFVTARQDPVIEFDWGRSSPSASLPQDAFSVRWSGKFTAPHNSGSRDYRFTLRTDDGNRLYLNGALVIDDWSDHGTESFSHTATFQSGETTNVTMEYYEKGGAAVAQLTVTDLLSNETISATDTVQVPSLNDSHSQDTDSDGIPDTWELRHGLNAWIDDASKISNSNGVSNLEAYNNQLNPWTLEPAVTVDGSPESTVPETSEPAPSTGGTVSLSWTAPGTRMDGTSILLSEIDYYEVEYGQSPENLTQIQRINGAETSYQFTNLSPGVWYFTIKVVDTNGLESPPSELVSHEVSK